MTPKLFIIFPKRNGLLSCEINVSLSEKLRGIFLHLGAMCRDTVQVIPAKVSSLKDNSLCWLAHSF